MFTGRLVGAEIKDTRPHVFLTPIQRGKEDHPYFTDGKTEATKDNLRFETT